MQLYNTLSKKVEQFEPLNPEQVTLYSCGPTVYDYTHLGHIRKYISDDILKRTLIYLGHKVNHVMNVTDVGHLTNDDDEGEDKLEKGAEKAQKTVWEVAEYYTHFFFETMSAVNVIKANTVCKATDHIQDMINLIKILEEKGYTYQTEEAVYFDVTKFPKYGQLSGQKLEDKIQAAREEVHTDQNKKNPADFALWFKRVGRFANHSMHWPSPWGEGFPGWHIECSAMSMKYLGETIDIHTGGVDHIPIHHENEIAQSESATGKQFVRFWVHDAFLNVNTEKMSKSLGNFYTLQDVEKQMINPLSLRLLFLQTHYRQPMDLSWEAAKASHAAYENLKQMVLVLQKQTQRTELSEVELKQINEYRQRFSTALAQDLQTPQAVAVMWEMMKSNIPSTDKLDLLFEFDKVLGLGLADVKEETIPDEIMQLAEERMKFKMDRDFHKADGIRRIIEHKGYIIEDKPHGFEIKKKTS